MSEGVLERVDALTALRTARDAVENLARSDWSAVSDDELLTAFRQFETARRQMAAVDHALIVEAEARDLAASLAYRNTAALLRSILRLGPREAAGRVRAAQAAGPRRGLTGEELPPTHPLVAEAQQRGAISPLHAAVITSTIAKLSDDARHTHGADIERSLVDYAEQFDADNLAKIARHLLYCYDQDGSEPDEDLRHRNRFLRLVQRADGSAHGEFEATAELAELLLTHFDALAAPAPAADGQPDPRSAGQRRHDALIESLRLVVRARLLPRVNGVTATVIVTMTKTQYERGQGLARTSHGALVPVQQALRWGGYGGDLRLLALALGEMRPVEAYGTTARLHNETQRLVLHAVHGGCTFPDCPVQAGHTQAHHVIDFAEGGETSVNLGAPVCSGDHHQRVAQGWRAEIIGRRVAWIPPTSVDPDQRPRCNDLHLPQLTNPTGDSETNPP